MKKLNFLNSMIFVITGWLFSLGYCIVNLVDNNEINQGSPFMGYSLKVYNENSEAHQTVDLAQNRSC